MSLQRFGDRLARLKTAPAEPPPFELPATPVEVAPDAGPSYEPLPGSVERLRPWWMADTPFGEARVFRERLDLQACVGGAVRSHGAPCPHPLDAILGDPRLSGFTPERALFLDIEATGLSHGAGTFAFLIGCAYLDGGDVVLEQLFIADPSDELPVLSRCRELLASRPFLVSFNGKSYDLSVLESRLVVNRLLSPGEASLKLQPHLDLLHVSRQAYKGVFPDTRLQTLEQRVLGLDPSVRADDVPGSMVPALYFHYLRTGYAPHVDVVLRHNRTDVLSMVSLTEHLMELFTRPSGEALVLSNLGRAALRRGLFDRAARLLLEALESGALRREDERRAVEDLITASRRAKRAGLLDLARARLLDLLTPDEEELRRRVTTQVASAGRVRSRRPVAG